MPAITDLTGTVAFARNGAPALLDAAVSVSLPDGALDGGRLIVRGLRTDDRVSILAEGSGAGQISLSGSDVLHGGITIGSFAGGVGDTLTVTFNAAATAPAVEALIERLAYANVSGTPAALRTLVLDLEDAAGTNLSAPAAPSFLGFEPILSRSIVLGGSYLKPALADLDGDGDVDIVVGNSSGTLTVYRNVGRFDEPPQAASPFNGIDVGHRSAPAFGDFDGDGDLDLAVGNNIGKVYAWRNHGGTFTVLEPADNPFDSVNVAADATPAFVDLDGDGDVDLVVGADNGTLRTWRNDGGVFTALTGATNPFDGIGVGSRSTPSFVDMDRDGDPDLVVGQRNGALQTWRNEGGTFIALPAAQNPWPIASGSFASNLAPTFWDMTGDGLAEIVLGLDIFGAALNISYNATPGASIQVRVTDAPVITSGTTSRFAEYRLDAAYQAAASDSDGRITWSLSGADAALFSIDSMTGAVRFLARPDYEAPADAGADNVYDIAVVARDMHGVTTSQDVAITVISRETPARLTGFAPAVTFGENAVNAAPALLDTEVSFTAPELGLNGATLAVRGLLAEDRVSILPEGDAAGQIGVAGTVVSYGGVAIGILGGGVGGTFTVTFNAAATATAVEALIERLAYANVSGTPTATRALSLDVVDPAGSRLNAPLMSVFTALTGSANPLNGYDAGTYSVPAFNRDGEGVLISGRHDGTLGIWSSLYGEFLQIYGDVGFESAPTFADIDGDGDRDLVVGSSSGTLAVWRIGPGSATQLTGTSNPFNGIDVGYGSKPAFLDLDGDGDQDLVVGSLDGTLRAWRNDGGAFTALTGAANPFNGIDVGYSSAPTFADLDGDVDLELVVGAFDGTLRTWRNDGGSFAALTGSANPFAGIDVGSSSAPTFTDLDRDGDLDLVVGNLDGIFQSWRNDRSGAVITVTVTAEDDGPPVITSGATGRLAENRRDIVYTATGSDSDGPVTWSLSGVDAALFTIDSATGVVRFLSPPDHERPGDADADNVHDITVVATDIHGTTTGKAVAITVTDVVDPPRLAGLATSVTFDENVVNTAPVLLDAAVDFTALETGFAGGRLVVKGLLAEDRISILAQGDAAGQIGVAGSTVSYGGVAIGTVSGGAGGTFMVVFNAAATAPAVDALIERLAYANVSGTPTATRTLDLQVVDAAGALLDAPLAPVFVAPAGSENPLAGIAAGPGAAPVLADFDGDGDLDLVVATNVAQVRAWRNEGGSFTALTGTANPFAGIDLDTYGAPAFTDLDGDGDLDFVLGTEAGALHVWRNDAGAFTALTGAANPFDGIDIGSFSAPAFADLDGDGDRDLAVGMLHDGVRFWRNDGGTFTALPGGTYPLSGATTGNLAKPAFIDLDGDGRPDLVTGNVRGELLAWRFDGSAFIALTGTANPLNGIDLGDRSAPAAADLNGDGLVDLVAGALSGGLFVRLNATPGLSITVNVTAQDDGPPVITSTSASFAENRGGIVYQAQGSDSDGPITWSLSGRDSALFDMDVVTGAIRVLAPLDHEAPADAGANNVYDLVITARDVHGSTTSRDIALTVTNLADTPPRLAGLSSAVTFAENAVNARPALLDADVAFTAPESGFAGARLTIRGLLAEDRISILAQGHAPGQIGVTGTTVRHGGVAIGTVEGGVGDTFTVTLNAAATAPAVDALIQRLAYANVSDTPSAARTLTIDVVDAGGRHLNAPLTTTYFPLEGSANPIEAPNDIQQRGAAFADLDGDGDLDMVMTTWGSTLNTWRNDGGRFVVLRGADNPFASFDLGRSVSPAFVDLDGDGDLDLVVGRYDGTLTTLRNDGGVFTRLTGTANPLNGIDAGYNSAPAFLDLDGDGDLDLVVGENTGRFLAWRRDGATFTALTGAANPFDGVASEASDTAPAFLDLDGDGDLDLVSGEGAGTVLSWRNEGGSFTPILGTNPFGGIDSGFNSSPAFVDLDGDGDLDLVMGDDYGGVVAWRIDTPGTTITVTVTAELEQLRLVGGPGNESLLGGEGNDTLDGDAGNDTLAGGAGNDALRGGAGADRLEGGDGLDSVSYSGSVLGVVVNLTSHTVSGGDAAGDTISGFEHASGGNGDDHLIGDALDNSLSGNDGSDTLAGGEGNDGLDGGLGADSMVGGAGNDVYVVDNAGDAVGEAANGGIDRVNTARSYVLAAHVEQLLQTGTADITGTGNALGNSLTGNAGANVLDGLEGNDTVNGGAGADTLVGGEGNDGLNGGLGADSLIGGAGNDVYVVDDAGDVVGETADGGIDRVDAAISYTLGATLENLVLTGTADLGGTGNALVNSITGNSGANILDGAGANDSLYGLAGADTLIGGEGHDGLDGGLGADSLIGGAGNDVYVIDDAGDVVVETADGGIDRVNATISHTLAANVELLLQTGAANITGTGNALANSLTGNAGANVLDGLAGNDRLTGGAGADTLAGGEGDDGLDGGLGADSLIGGAGNDVYVIDDAGDVVVETADGGIDRVNATISHMLSANVEQLLLTGTGNLNGTGNALANALTGNAGANVLDGDAGNDALNGGAGADTLVGGDGNDGLDGGVGADSMTGGLGADRFVFRSAAEADGDIVADFNAGQGDRIDLRPIDTNPGLGGDQGFAWIGDAGFGRVAGELRFASGLLQGDVDGDGQADFQIGLSGVVSLTAAQIWL